MRGLDHDAGDADMDGTTEGSCHCGKVRVTVPLPPEQVIECHCSICRRYGALWYYNRPTDVTVTGPIVVYAWGPKDIGFHRCGECGCVIGWFALGMDPGYCGVNARLLEGFDARTATRLVKDDWSLEDGSVYLRDSQPR